VLRLVIDVGRSSAHLDFVRHIGNPSSKPKVRQGSSRPIGVVLLPYEGGGQETVLVAYANHRVSQFKLDGTFIRVFAGTGRGIREFSSPRGITVLGSSGEVAVADGSNHRVQIFDSKGNHKRQFGSEGGEADGQFERPQALAADAHGNLLVLDATNRLQVFSPKGKHLCTRNDLEMAMSFKGIAWSDVGELAVADGNSNKVLLWRNE
jgi:DNA-binding beta-propeller fold protein YncE